MTAGLGDADAGAAAAAGVPKPTSKPAAAAAAAATAAVGRAPVAPAIQARVNGYGPSALATPANALTVVRLLAAPILVIMVLHRPTSWLTWAVWTALAGTDGIDGWLARRHGTTRSGAFLDPLADKFLVLGAMFALVASHRFSWVPVAIIAAREVAISLYRIVAARHGVSVPARTLAKAKTMVQSLAVGAMVLPVTGHHPILAVSALWVAVALTVVSGAQYYAEARKGASPASTAGTAAGIAGIAGGAAGTAGTAATAGTGGGSGPAPAAPA
ncbi:MAG: CDP-diacylglycerol---glycerol-3-phosphate 3-phosphatidyltransferase [Acidimicrobiaceae bacterium]|nr:CDP-diacylglycerol---glycerol-3-phosphate 3-phosphatidyltransferase [Acidimicrobiaceae bacterium]